MTSYEQRISDWSSAVCSSDLHVSGFTGDWFNWRAKVNWVTMILRDRWMAFDIASVAVFYLILFKGVRDPNIQYSRNLTLSALFMLAVYLLLPRIVFGSAYADMRLAPLDRKSTRLNSSP